MSKNLPLKAPAPSLNTVDLSIPPPGNQNSGHLSMPGLKAQGR